MRVGVKNGCQVWLRYAVRTLNNNKGLVISLMCLYFVECQCVSVSIFYDVFCCTKEKNALVIARIIILTSIFIYLFFFFRILFFGARSPCF